MINESKTDEIGLDSLLCGFKECAENQRRIELKREGNDYGCHGYKQTGCYACDGFKKDCNHRNQLIRIYISNM